MPGPRRSIPSPAFREAFRQRRCLVPRLRQFLRMGQDPDRQAALRDRAQGRGRTDGDGRIVEDLALAQQGERIRSFTIATTTPNELCAKLHNRMPVVLEPEAWPMWLGEEPADLPHLKALLAPYPSDDMVCWPVSTRVGNVKNNDPSLIDPIRLQ